MLADHSLATVFKIGSYLTNDLLLQCENDSQILAPLMALCRDEQERVHPFVIQFEHRYKTNFISFFLFIMVRRSDEVEANYPHDLFTPD